MLARWGVLVVVGSLAIACVDLRYPRGAPDGGAFVKHLELGADCSMGAECQSGFCVDQVCCNGACDETCKTCSKTGSRGFCMFADVGSNPRNECKDLGCAQIPSCDGAGNCQKRNTGELCGKSASCRVRNLSLAQRCDVDGNCAEPAIQDCYPFFCSDGADQCLTQCTADKDCQSNSCVNGTCGKKPLGSACGGPGECDSNLCESNVCCKTACKDGCRSCALMGSAGTCTPIPAGTMPLKAADNPDPCHKVDASTCGLDGTCDGAGACRLYLLGQACNPASCANAALRNVGTCDGKGKCQVPTTVTCGGYTCGTPTSCRTTCSTDPDCASPSVCGHNSCGGLSAQYFRMTNLTDLAFMRTDPAVDFDWGGTSPSTLLNVDNFSVRWRGKITPRFSEKYTFFVGSDDGERLTVNGVLLINRFIRHASVPEDVGNPAIQLTAGVPVDIILEYFENGGDANVRLLWQSQSEPKAVVPTSALAPQ